MRAIHVLLLIAPCAIAANQPTFTYTVPAFASYTVPAGAAVPTKVAAVAVDRAGNTYLTGSTANSPFATSGALQTQFAGGICDSLFTPGGLFEYPCTDAFVIKLDPAGAVLFATYLGGDGNETAGSAIALDAEGNIYVAGTTFPNTNTSEPDTFPVTPGAAFTNPATNAGSSFVAKLNPNGSKLIFATFLPILAAGTVAMAIDPGGNAYIASTTAPDQSTNPIPTTPGAFQAAPQNSSSAGVVLKLSASGAALVYATYLSGSVTSGIGRGWDVATGIAVDAAGEAFVTGYTGSQNFPVTPGAFETQYPSVVGEAGFVTKLNPQGTGLVYSTFYSTSLQSIAGGGEIRVDSQGGAWVLGQGYEPAQGGNPASTGGFLAHLSADGSSLLYSDYLPATGLDVDSVGNVYVAGIVNCACLPVVPGAFQPDYGVAPVTLNIQGVPTVTFPPEVFAMKFTPDGQVAGATYSGGAYGSAAVTLAVAPNGSVVISGTTISPDFPGISGPVNVPTGFVTSIFPAVTLENSASYVANTAVPGEMVSIQGYGIGPLAGVTASPASAVGGVQVFFDNFSAPITYAQSRQINAQVPWEVTGKTTTQVQIVYSGMQVGNAVVPVGAALPGVFSINNSDGSHNSPSNPALPGDFVSVYGTGGGAMSPPGVTGNSWPLTPLSFLAQPVSATVGGEAAAVLYIGAAPTLDSGFFQINVRLPADLTAAAQFLCVTIGVVTSAPAAISIQ